MEDACGYLSNKRASQLSSGLRKSHPSLLGTDDLIAGILGACGSCLSLFQSLQAHPEASLPALNYQEVLDQLKQQFPR